MGKTLTRDKMNKSRKNEMFQPNDAPDQKPSGDLRPAEIPDNYK